MYVSLPGIKREFVRCQDCAGSAPPELPALHGPPVITPTPFAHVIAGAPKRTRGALKEAVREWMPYREPGMEG